MQVTPALRVHMFREEDPVLAVRFDHPQAVVTRVQLKDLAADDFVGFPLKEGRGSRAW